jgi:hypothetical protein
MRLRLMLAAAAVAILATVPAAFAATPDKVSFSFTDEEQLSICPFPLRVRTEVRVIDIVYYDQNGNWTRDAAHVAVHADITNVSTGKTFADDDHYVDIIFADGSDRVAGLVFLLRLDGTGRSVYHRSGTIVFSAPGVVTFSSAKADVTDRDALCAALA